MQERIGKMGEFLNINMDEFEFRKVLEIIAETDPHIDYVEDIEMYLTGMKPELDETTKEFLINMREPIESTVISLRKLAED